MGFSPCAQLITSARQPLSTAKGRVVTFLFTDLTLGYFNATALCYVIGKPF